MDKKKYSAVLFDLDGTLLDTLEDISIAMNHILEERGFPTHQVDDYRYFVGDGLDKLVNKTLPPEKRNDKINLDCQEAFKNYYAVNWRMKTKPYEGISEMLDAITAKGVKTAILSNKPHEFTILFVDELLSRWKFDIVFGQREAIPRKPDPSGAIEIAEKLGILPSDCLFVGDTSIDIKTAIAAGMFPVGVLWGFRQREELESNGAMYIMNHPMEILNLLE